MSTLFTGHKTIRLQNTDSTNAHAFRLLTENAADGTLIQAEYQSQGRGQKGNTWLAPPGLNLMFSLIYYPSFLPLTQLFQLSKAVSLGVQESLQAFLPEKKVEIKWPNDILLDQKKCAGILIENQLEGSRLKAAVIGIGINVNQLLFPPEIQHSATSLRQHTDEDLDRDALLQHLMAQIEKQYLRLKAEKHALIDRAYYDHLYGYQENTRMQDENGPFEGQIMGLDAQGRLGVAVAEKLRYYDFKEVQFLLG